MARCGLPLDVGPKKFDREKIKKGRERRDKGERGERNSNFSLRSTEIGGSVFVGPRTKRSSTSQRLRMGTKNMRFRRGFK